MADRIALMRNGQPGAGRQPADIYRAGRNLFAARFFCELNEVVGVVRGGAAETVLGRFAAPGLAEGITALWRSARRALRAPVGRRRVPVAAFSIASSWVMSIWLRWPSRGSIGAPEGAASARRHPAG